MTLGGKKINILGSHFFVWTLGEKQLSNSLLYHETSKLKIENSVEMPATVSLCSYW